MYTKQTPAPHRKNPEKPWSIFSHVLVFDGVDANGMASRLRSNKASESEPLARCHRSARDRVTNDKPQCYHKI